MNGRTLRATCRTGLFVTALGASIGILAGSPAGQTPPQTPPQPPQAAGQVPSFKTGIDVVSLNVTVTEAGPGTPRYVTDLEKTDFEVYEGGVKQDVTVFNKTNSPIALSLLMDSSASMESKLGTAQEAAIGFARKLRPQDLAEVVDFDSRAMITQTFTGDVAKLEHAIRQASAGGPTAMYQALYIALDQFNRLKKTDVASESPRRQAIILLSDGQDTSSMFSFDDILDRVKRAETAVYTIGLRSSDEPSSRGFNEAEFELRQFAQQSGGRAFFPHQIGDLADVYGQISDELSSQYTLGYTSRNQRRDGTWRSIVVRVNRANTQQPRTKLGYFASSN